MKFIPNYGDFRNSLNEASLDYDGFVNNTKLGQAADIICSFLNKKTKLDFRVFPFGIKSNGIDGVMLYSAKGTAAVRIGGKGMNRGPGIVGDLAYFSDAAKSNADFVMSSDSFPIVALVSEFGKLISEPSYVQEVETLQESVNEAARGVLKPQEQKMVMKQLKSGKSAAKIARDLGISYGAILKLKTKPSLVLIDGNKLPDLKNYKLEYIIKGDQKIPSISAASIIAKVSRDKFITKLSKEFDNYGWDTNSGYGTKEHLKAIKKFGITKYHRKTFSPVSDLL